MKLRKMYQVYYTFLIGGKTVEHQTDTDGLIKLLRAAENLEVTLHRITPLLR